MVVSFVRTVAIVLCVFTLLSGCGNQISATSNTTTVLYGATTIALGSTAAPSLGIVTDANLRVVTIDVRAAARTTLQPDDVITRWKGQPVTVNSLRQEIASTEPTETIEMTIQRGGTSVVISITVLSTTFENTTGEIPATPTPVPSDLYYF